MSVTKLGTNAFKVPRRSRRRRRQEKKRFGRLEISPHKTTSCRHRQQKIGALNAKTYGCVVNYHPSNWVKCSCCLLEGAKKKATIFFYYQVPHASKQLLTKQPKCLTLHCCCNNLQLYVARVYVFLEGRNIQRGSIILIFAID